MHRVDMSAPAGVHNPVSLRRAEIVPMVPEIGPGKWRPHDGAGIGAVPNPRGRIESAGDHLTGRTSKALIGKHVAPGPGEPQQHATNQQSSKDTPIVHQFSFTPSLTGGLVVPLWPADSRLQPGASRHNSYCSLSAVRPHSQQFFGPVRMEGHAAHAQECRLLTPGRPGRKHNRKSSWCRSRGSGARTRPGDSGLAWCLRAVRTFHISGPFPR